METKHTPGPWSVSREEENAIVAEELPYIATVHWAPEQEFAANARLVAAAPELLEFAQWAMSQFCGDSGTGETHWEQYREFVSGKSAIAKATGEDQ